MEGNKYPCFERAQIGNGYLYNIGTGTNMSVWTGEGGVENFLEHIKTKFGKMEGMEEEYRGLECVNPLDQAYLEVMTENDRRKNTLDTIKVLHRLIVSCVVDERASVGGEPRFKNLYSEEEVDELKAKISELIDEL